MAGPEGGRAVSPRPSIYILGGGLSGIAAAERLSRDPDAPYHVVLIEARPHLGGRTGSYFDTRARREIDTGQHLFLSCYTGTIDLLQRLGTKDDLVFFDRLYIPLWDPERGLNPLDVPGNKSQLSAAGGLLQYEGLPFSQRLAFLSVARAMPGSDSDVDHLTAHEFLKRAGQPDVVIDRFWELVILSATNLPSRSVSAALLVRILKESLLAGGHAARPGYNAVPLTELFVLPAMRLFRARSVSVRTKTRITGLTETGGRIVSLATSQGEIPLSPEDRVIVALPPWSFEKIVPLSWQETPLVDRINRLSYASPILSIHLHFDTPVRIPLIAGFHQSPIHWLFNKDAMEQRLIPETRPWFDWSEDREDDLLPTQMVSATVSGADTLLETPDAELAALVSRHLLLLDKKNTASPKGIVAVRDRFATPVLGTGQSSLRPEARTSFANLFMAGDTADTGLPATMESAVRAGVAAAEAILSESSARPIAPGETAPPGEKAIPA